jgi:hypothetical protein
MKRSGRNVMVGREHRDEGFGTPTDGTCCSWQFDTNTYVEFQLASNEGSMAFADGRNSRSRETERVMTTQTLYRQQPIPREV